MGEVRRDKCALGWGPWRDCWCPALIFKWPGALETAPQLNELPTEGCQHGTPPWLAWSPAPNPLLFQMLFQKLDFPQEVVSQRPEQQPWAGGCLQRWVGVGIDDSHSAGFVRALKFLSVFQGIPGLALSQDAHRSGQQGGKGQAAKLPLWRQCRDPSARRAAPHLASPQIRVTVPSSKSSTVTATSSELV